MNILFICGSLEPGHDGVGDYTRRLAAELCKVENQCRVVSLAEPKLSDVLNDYQYIGDVSIPVLRLPSNYDWKTRFELAKAYIDDFNPDWISLQYVIFSFHNKGIPLGFANQLHKMNLQAKWHIMFHELWIGIDSESSIKHKLIGRVQRYIIKNMLKILKPAIVHTHTRLYQIKLASLGFKSSIFPLFGNIQKVYHEYDEKPNQINIGVFGTIHYGAQLETFLLWLANSNNVKFVFHFIGSNGNERAEWIKLLELHKVDYIVHGWLEDEAVSKILTECKWGLTTTPYYLTQKSGSVAAMLEHGETVLCIGREWKPAGVVETDLFNNSVINWNGNLNINEVINYNNVTKTSTLQDLSLSFSNQLK